MPKKNKALTLYVSDARAVGMNLQQMAYQLGFVATRGPLAGRGGSQGSLIEAIAHMPPERWPELGKLLGMTDTEIYINQEFG